MTILDLFLKSDKPHVVEARKIPQQATDFFDTQHKVADGFTTGEKKGDPTQFKPAALNEYDVEVKNLTPPPSFNAQDPLHRYTPTLPYYQPGQKKA